MNSYTSMPMARWLEQAWLARYLDRELSADETAWFETYALGSPQLLAMIEADNRLKEALQADSALLTTPASLPRSRTARPARWLALAASAVIGVGVGALGVRALSPDRSPDAIASPMRVVFDTQRGAALPAHVEFQDSDSPYALVEVALPADATDIRFVLGGSTPRAAKLSPDGFASILVKRGGELPSASLSVLFRRPGDAQPQRIELAPLPKRGFPQQLQ